MIKKNIAANLTGRVWGIVSVYLFVPLYLKFLGVEAYGLVGFYSTLMGILAFADMGLTATLNREMARLDVRKDSAEEMRDLLRTYESVYGFISLLVALLIWILAPSIANRWLHSKTLPPHEISSAVRLMGIALSFQLSSGLFIGGLMGLQKQVLTNSLQIAWGVLRGIGAVFVLWLISPTIFAFAFWQLISNAFYLFAARFGLWNALATNAVRPKFKWIVFRNTWQYAANMTALALTTTFLTQIDKIIVSKLMPLEMLGYYTLAGILASVPLMLASPIALAVFPRLIGMVEAGDHMGVARLYHRTCEIIAVAIIPGGLTLILFAKDFILAWTGSVTASERAAPSASLLIAGQLMQALCVVPYYLTLAHGNTRLVLENGIASVVLVVPLLFFFVTKYGILGAATSWLLMNIFTLPLLMFRVHRRFLPGEFGRWCRRGLVKPITATTVCVLLGRWLVHQPTSRLSSFFMVGLVWTVAAATTAFWVPELRNILTNRTRRLLQLCKAV